jgi:hypothetical protein
LNNRIVVSWTPVSAVVHEINRIIVNISKIDCNHNIGIEIPADMFPGFFNCCRRNFVPGFLYTLGNVLSLWFLPGIVDMSQASHVVLFLQVILEGLVDAYIHYLQYTR